MKKMKNLSILIVISLICVCIVGGSVLAEDGEYNRRKHIASKGVFDYSNSTVVLDSSDLIYLADEIDDLERAYKSSTVEALNRIGTFYVSTDGDISHECDDNNVSPDMAAELLFSDLYHGIVKSQSVDHLDNVQAEDAHGNPLYYADQNASDSNDLTSTTTDTNDYPVFIQPAAADNLTAGTAAWVDGDLIIGSGGDNAVYYDRGIHDFTEIGDFIASFRINIQEYQFTGSIPTDRTCYINVTVKRQAGSITYDVSTPLDDYLGLTNWFYQTPDGMLDLCATSITMTSFESIE